jgi:hypothetical protein
MSKIILPLALGAIIGFYAHAFLFSKKPVAAQINLSKNSTVIQEGNFKTQSIRIHAQAAGNNIQADAEDLSKIKMALDHLNDIADLNERTAARNTLLRRWANLDGPGALQYVSGMDEGEAKIQAMSTVAGVLVNSNPQLLAQQASILSGSRSDRELVQDLANSWAQSDVQSALAWANQLPDGIVKNDALSIIRFQLAKQNPQAASVEINQLPAGDTRNSLISNLAAQWGLANPQDAINWANTLPENEKKLAMSNLIGAWAQNDPLAAGTFAAQMPSGEAQNQATMSVVESWTAKDPKAAADWVLQFSDTELQEQGIREIIRSWAATDAASAEKWAEALPEGTTRDSALENFVESVAYWSPSKATGAVEFIQDTSKRQQSMETIMRSWSEIDPNAAQNWVENLNISGDLKSQLQSLQPLN